MRLFLDQMIDRSVAETLRKQGCDVQCTAEVGMACADDQEILKYCIDQNRTLVTLDEHFGDWTVARLTEHPGVIRLKVDPANTRNIQRAIVSFLDRYADRDFRNTLAIVKPTAIRWIHTA